MLVSIKLFLNSSDKLKEIIDISLFSYCLKLCVLCIKCKKHGIHFNFSRQNQGLATEPFICCDSCDFKQPVLNTIITQSLTNKGLTNVHEVNTRLLYAMRSIGKGYAAKEFCGVMNLPPITKCFYELSHTLYDAIEEVAKASMAIADKNI
ncbi:hypothetical protein NPIL_299031 [Nephila pilipes]|uniref:Mutator-like transposase domain-containing protein n=1 Tax=Nephila pilipes TaxID=299642 RepID=A0A8X6MNN2_NEPPI|nr:hypothetical protein NPIL_299031 [Nephila pilipes]